MHIHTTHRITRIPITTTHDRTQTHNHRQSRQRTSDSGPRMIASTLFRSTWRPIHTPTLDLQPERVVELAVRQIDGMQLLQIWRESPPSHPLAR